MYLLRELRAIVDELKELAIQTDVPIYKGDVIDDNYIKLSDVIEILEKYNPSTFPID